MGSRASNGRGNIYHRKDGRFQVSLRMKQADGTSKRVYATRSTRGEAEDLLHAKLEQKRRGIPAAPREWRVGDYLDHWLNEVVTVKNRPRTVELYEMYIRLYLKPRLDRKQLRELSVADVQTTLNEIAASRTVRLAHGTRSVLRAALNRAMREELISRNVASLTELPAWERKRITPWGMDEANRFLHAAEGAPWQLAFQLLITYGMRRGEVLGLRWRDIDFTRSTMAIEQQLQRIGSELVTGPIKTTAGRRTLPILPRTMAALQGHLEQTLRQSDRCLERLVQTDELVFLSKVGTPVDPKNFVRSFHLISESGNLPRIKMHHLRHTAATMLKNLGVPARDAQLILGHAQVSTTQELYQHGDVEGQTKALSRVEQQLLVAPDSGRGGQTWWSNAKIAEKFGDFAGNNLGGTSGLRSHDTLLKSLSGLPLKRLPTSVLEGVRALTRAYKFGAVVVKIGGQSAGSRSTPAAASFVAGLQRVLAVEPRADAGREAGSYV